MARRSVVSRLASLKVQRLPVIATVTVLTALVFSLSGCGSSSSKISPPDTSNLTEVSPIDTAGAVATPTTQDASLTTSADTNSGATTRSPAPALTYLEVYAVASENKPAYEYPAPSALITANDQGGKWLIVVTKELGYSTNQIAKFAGTKMTLVREDRILNGSDIVGYYRYWQYSSSFTSGQFTYQATGLVYPFNTKSDQINIR